LTLTAETRADRAGLGIVLMLLAWAFFASVDTAAKWLALLGVPALQLAFMRYAVSFGLSLTMGIRKGAFFEWPDTRVMGLVVLRAVLLILATVLNFTALAYLPLAVTATLMNSAPLILTALAVPLLGERVGPFRWAAVILGFVGVVVVIRPLDGAFHWASLLVLINATALALFAILTRLLSGRIATQTMQLYMGAIGTAALILPALAVWQMPQTALEWGLLFSLGAFAWTGHEIYSRAHAFAEASVLVPFNYAFIVYLTIAGYLVFDDIPEAPVLFGAAIIIASGLIVWWRETSLR
jgi:drug/metabolite transporter (DMT)-like permease